MSLFMEESIMKRIVLAAALLWPPQLPHTPTTTSSLTRTLLGALYSTTPTRLRRIALSSASLYW